MNDLETGVLELIGESTTDPDVFTDDSTGMAQVRDSLNDAIEEITMLTGSVKRNYILPMESGMNFYRLSLSRGRLGWITNAWNKSNNRRLDQTDFVQLLAINPRWLSRSGPPELYAPIGKDMVCLYPAPASTSGVLIIECVVIPERYVYDDEKINLRDSFKWAAINYAVGEYWASRGDAKTAAEHHQQYLKHLGIQAMYPETSDRRWEAKTK